MIITGALLLYYTGLSSSDSKTITVWQSIIIGVAIVLSLSGVAMMFVQLRGSDQALAINERPESYREADYIVRQLSQNYQILRNQTSQGFYLSSVFMTVGMMMIIASLFGSSFGLQNTGTNLTTLGGILLEFISGTALLIYRLNFKRLNETSDKLDAAWRILAAYKLTEGLPEEKKSEATLKLIEALVQKA